MTHVAREIDDGHAFLADLTIDLVASRKCGGQRGDFVCHRFAAAAVVNRRTSSRQFNTMIGAADARWPTGRTNRNDFPSRETS